MRIEVSYPKCAETESFILVENGMPAEFIARQVVTGEARARVAGGVQPVFNSCHAAHEIHDAPCKRERSCLAERDTRAVRIIRVAPYAESNVNHLQHQYSPSCIRAFITGKGCTNHVDQRSVQDGKNRFDVDRGECFRDVGAVYDIASLLIGHG